MKINNFKEGLKEIEYQIQVSLIDELYERQEKDLCVCFCHIITNSRKACIACPDGDISNSR